MIDLLCTHVIIWLQTKFHFFTPKFRAKYLINLKVSILIGFEILRILNQVALFEFQISALNFKTKISFLICAVYSYAYKNFQFLNDKY